MQNFFHLSFWEIIIIIYNSIKIQKKWLIKVEKRIKSDTSNTYIIPNTKNNKNKILYQSIKITHSGKVRQEKSLLNVKIPKIINNNIIK